MKKLFYLPLVLLTSLVLNGCNQQKTNDHENIQLIVGFEDAFRNQDYEKMQSMFTDDYMSYGPSLADSMRKEDVMLNWKYNMENLYDKVDFHDVKHIALTDLNNGVARDWVSSWGKLTIKYQNRTNEAEIWSNTLYLIEDGKIKKSYIFYNEADALRQVGFHYVFREPAKLDE